MKIIINKKIVIDTSKKPLIIAEISANHNGNRKLFLELIKKAHKSGADLIKIQTYEPKDIVLKNISQNHKISGGLWKNKNLWDLYNNAQTPFDWHNDAFKLSKKIGATIFSTPFNIRALKFLKKYNMPVYKIASLEITDLNLVKEIAKTKKPVIISTGGANYKEIKKAVSLIKKYHSKIIILHCVSGYPTPENEVNLSTINLIKKKFNTKFVGLSDHTKYINTSLASLFYGVCIIEKHFKLNNNIETLDSKFSLNEKEFTNLVKKSKIYYNMIGKPNFKIKKSEKEALTFRRSIYSIKKIKKNVKFTKKNIATFRPMLGIGAENYFKILGKKSNKNIEKFQPIYNIDIIK